MSTSGTGNSVSFKNLSQISYSNYFVKGDNVNNTSVMLENSQVNSINIISKNAPTLTVNTNGTWSSIKSIPINTGIADFDDNVAAVTAGYITGMSYFNTTEKAISRVS